MGFQNYFEKKVLSEYVFFELFWIEQNKKIIDFKILIILENELDLGSVY